MDVETILALAGLVAVMVLSAALGFVLEWLCLRGAFLLLPRASNHAATPQAHCDAQLDAVAGFH